MWKKALSKLTPFNILGENIDAFSSLFFLRLLFLFLLFLFLSVAVIFYSCYSGRDRNTQKHITAKITRFLRLFLLSITVLHSLFLQLASECARWTQGARRVSGEERRTRRHARDQQYFTGSTIESLASFWWCSFLFVCQSLTSVRLPVSSANELANFKVVQLAWSKFKIEVFDAIGFFVATFSNWTT